MKFDKLYHKSKSGKIHSWEVWSEGNTIFSLAGTDEGKKILSSRVCTPKNEGKKNATTAEEQADKEAMAMWKHKLERKYSLTPEEAQVIDEVLPMLAQDFYKRRAKVVYPVLVEPKLDGARALAFWEDDKVVLKSRGNKYWTNLEHITKELEHILPKDTILDGELYIKDVPFQTLMSWTKRLQPDTLKIEYHIYDSAKLNMEETCLTRKENIQAIIDSRKLINRNLPDLLLAPTNLRIVEGFYANNEDEVEKYHSDFVEQGYEGAIVRILDGVYEFNYRSYSLLKVKSFQDAEFKIVGYGHGLGKFTDAVIFTCEDSEGRQFKAIPKMPQEVKEELLRNAKSYIGKMATIQYFGFSTEGVPRFPVLIKIRDEKDLSENLLTY